MNRKIIKSIIVLIAIVFLFIFTLFFKMNKDITDNNQTEIESANEPANVTNNLNNEILNAINENKSNYVNESKIITRVKDKVDNNVSLANNYETDNDNKKEKNISHSASNNSTQNIKIDQHSNNKNGNYNSKNEVEKVTLSSCSDGHHIISIGNTNKWFDTKKGAIDFYNNTYSYWSNKWEKFEIDDDTFHKNCPNRYELYQCSCGKWTIDFFYEY